MMIYYTIAKENDIKALVTSRNYLPFDDAYGLGKTEEELERTGVLVEEEITPENNGKNAILYINPQTKEQWYEYTDIPKTETELLNDKLDNAILELTTLFAMGGM